MGELWDNMEKYLSRIFYAVPKEADKLNVLMQVVLRLLLRQRAAKTGIGRES